MLLFLGTAFTQSHSQSTLSAWNTSCTNVFKQMSAFTYFASSKSKLEITSHWKLVWKVNQVSIQKLVGAAPLVLQLAAQCTQCSWLRRQSATGAALDLRRLTWVIGQQTTTCSTGHSYLTLQDGSWEDHWAGSTRSAMQIWVHNDKGTSFLLILYAVHWVEAVLFSILMNIYSILFWSCIPWKYCWHIIPSE